MAQPDPSGATNPAVREPVESPSAEIDSVKLLPNVSNLLGLSNLTINPKVIARTD
jgi:hypothetical protein